MNDNKIKLAEMVCVSCGYKWYPRTENPKKCPYCERYRCPKKK